MAVQVGTIILSGRAYCMGERTPLPCNVEEFKVLKGELSQQKGSL